MLSQLFATPVSVIGCPEAAALNPLMWEVVRALEARTAQYLAGKAVQAFSSRA